MNVRLIFHNDHVEMFHDVYDIKCSDGELQFKYMHTDYREHNDVRWGGRTYITVLRYMADMKVVSFSHGELV